MCPDCNLQRMIRDDSTSIKCRSCSKKEERLPRCGDISGIMFNKWRSQAERRGIQFELTIEELWELYEKQKGVCYYSGIDIPITSTPNAADGLASIDRLNPNKGYTIDNVVWCHKQVNYMKHTLTLDEFKEFINLIYNNWSSN